MSNSKNRNSKLPPKEYLDKIKGKWELDRYKN